MLRRTTILASLLLAAGLAGPAHAALPQQSGHVDLLGQGDGAFSGLPGSTRFYDLLGTVGDVTGDGIDDVAIARGFGATYEVVAMPGGALPAGSVGAGLPSGALRIRFGAADGGWATEVAAAGDVNGDGIGDLVVGMPGATNAGSSSGSAWVVFGRSGGGTVDLAAGGGGFRIDGRPTDGGDRLGGAVAGAGDVDGDGLDDVIVSAAHYGATNAGGAIVVRGSASTAAVATGSLGTRGFRIVATLDDGVGDDVAGAGDVDGDGLDDVLVGGIAFAGPAGALSGAAWVVRGRQVAAPTTVTLPTGAGAWADGFRIDGPDDTAYTGWVGAAGDVNSDGLADVAVGGTGDDRHTVNGGHISIVFGRAPGVPVSLSALGHNGYEVVVKSVEQAFGRTFIADRDITGDGRPDLVAGAQLADVAGRDAAGRVYVVPSRSAGNATIDAATAGGIIRIDGSRGGTFDTTASNAGFLVAAGDVDGDARADVLTMQRPPKASVNGQATGPEVRVVRGFGEPRIGTLADAAGTVGSPLSIAGPAVLARTGTPSFSVAPALPAGLALDPATGAISGTPTASADATYTVTMSDLAGSVSTPLRLQVAALPGTGGGIAGGAGGGASADRTAPSLTGARMVRSRVARKRRPEVALTLSEAATVTVAFEREVAGRRSGRRCVKPSVKLRRARRCVRTVAVRSVRADLGAGARRVTGPKGLARGRYRAVLTARDAAGNASARKVLRFIVAAR